MTRRQRRNATLAALFALAVLALVLWLGPDAAAAGGMRCELLEQDDESLTLACDRWPGLVLRMVWWRNGREVRI